MPSPRGYHSSRGPTRQCSRQQQDGGCAVPGCACTLGAAEDRDVPPRGYPPRVEGSTEECRQVVPARNSGSGPAADHAAARSAVAGDRLALLPPEQPIHLCQQRPRVERTDQREPRGAMCERCLLPLTGLVHDQERGRIA